MITHKNQSWQHTGLKSWLMAVVCLTLFLGSVVTVHAANASPNILNRLLVKEAPDKTIISIHGTINPTFTVFKLANPSRIFIDVVDADLSALGLKRIVRNGVINDITAIQLNMRGRRMGRLIITFDRDASYDIKTKGNILNIYVDGTARRLPSLQLSKAQAESKRLKLAIKREKNLLSNLKAARVQEELQRKRAIQARLKAEELIRQVNLARQKAERLRLSAQTDADRITRELKTLKSSHKLGKVRVDALNRAIRAEEARKLALQEERIKLAAIRKLNGKALAEEESRLSALRVATNRARTEKIAAEKALVAVNEQRVAAQKLAKATMEGSRRKTAKLQIALNSKNRAVTSTKAALARQRALLQEAKVAAAQAEARLRVVTMKKSQLEAARRLATDKALAQEKERSTALAQALVRVKHKVRIATKIAQASQKAQSSLAKLEIKLQNQRNSIKKAQSQAEVERARINLIKGQLISEKRKLTLIRKNLANEEGHLVKLRKDVSHLRDVRKDAQGKALVLARRVDRLKHLRTAEEGRVANLRSTTKELESRRKAAERGVKDALKAEAVARDRAKKAETRAKEMAQTATLAGKQRQAALVEARTARKKKTAALAGAKGAKAKAELAAKTRLAALKEAAEAKNRAQKIMTLAQAAQTKATAAEKRAMAALARLREARDRADAENSRSADRALAKAKSEAQAAKRSAITTHTLAAQAKRMLAKAQGKLRVSNAVAKAANARATKAAKALKDNQQRISDLQEAMVMADVRAQKLEKQIVFLKAAVKQKRAVATNNKNRVAGQVRRAKQILAKLRANRANEEDRLAKLRKDVKQLRTTRKDAQGKAIVLAQRVDKLKDERNQTENRVATLRSTMNILEARRLVAARGIKAARDAEALARSRAKQAESRASQMVVRAKLAGKQRQAALTEARSAAKKKKAALIAAKGAQTKADVALRTRSAALKEAASAQSRAQKILALADLTRARAKTAEKRAIAALKRLQIARQRASSEKTRSASQALAQAKAEADSAKKSALATHAIATRARLMLEKAQGKVRLAQAVAKAANQRADKATFVLSETKQRISDLKEAMNMAGVRAQTLEKKIGYLKSAVKKQHEVAAAGKQAIKLAIRDKLKAEGQARKAQRAAAVAQKVARRLRQQKSQAIATAERAKRQASAARAAKAASEKMAQDARRRLHIAKTESKRAMKRLVAALRDARTNRNAQTAKTVKDTEKHAIALRVRAEVAEADLKAANRGKQGAQKALSSALSKERKAQAQVQHLTSQLQDEKDNNKQLRALAVSNSKQLRALAVSKNKQLRALAISNSKQLAVVTAAKNRVMQRYTDLSAAKNRVMQRYTDLSAAKNRVMQRYTDLSAAKERQLKALAAKKDKEVQAIDLARAEAERRALGESKNAARAIQNEKVALKRHAKAMKAARAAQRLAQDAGKKRNLAERRANKAESVAKQAKQKAAEALRQVAMAVMKARRTGRSDDRDRLIKAQEQATLARNRAIQAEKDARLAEKRLAQLKTDVFSLQKKSLDAMRLLKHREGDLGRLKKLAKAQARQIMQANAKLQSVESRALRFEREAKLASKRASYRAKRLKNLLKLAQQRHVDAADSDKARLLAEQRAKEAERKAATADQRTAKALMKRAFSLRRAQKLQKEVTRMRTRRALAESYAAKAHGRALEAERQAVAAQKKAAQALRKAASAIRYAKKKLSRSTAMKVTQALIRARAAERKAENAGAYVRDLAKRAVAAEGQSVANLKRLIAAKARGAQLEKRAKDAEARMVVHRGAYTRLKKLVDHKDQQRQVDAHARKLAEARAAQYAQRLESVRRSDAAMPVLSDVDYGEKNGIGRVKLSWTGSVPYEVIRHNSRRYELKFTGAKIPKSLERSLDASGFKGPVKMISSFRSASEPGVVRVIVELRENATGHVTSNGNAVVWAFSTRPMGSALAQAPNKMRDPRTIPGQRLPPGVRAYPGVVAAEGGSIGPQRSAFEAAARVMKRKRGKRKYRGKKINLTIKDADIRHVLTFLAKEGNVNIVASDKVKGTVTVHLENIRWDLALDMILKTQGYDYVREAGVFRVAPADDIREEFEAELKKKKTIAELKPQVVRFITVNYAKLEKLAKHVQTVLTKNGIVSADQATSTLIVKDLEEHVQAAEDVVRRLDVQLPQVLIEARIVEASTSFSQEMGVQWGGNFTMAPAFGNPTGLSFPSILGVSGGADDSTAPTEGLLSSNPNFAVNLPAAVGAGAGGALGLTLGSLGGAGNLSLRLSAAESRGQVKIVSAPKILTIDGNKATITQGLSIPVPVVSANGVNTQFFNADLKLEVMTNSSPDGNIRLDVNITKNEPDFGQTSANGAPTIQKKEAQTSLLVRDGDTTVIGGIYTRNTGRSTSSVPFLSKIPILGYLFKNHRETDKRSELLIFITPRIANRRASVVKGGGVGR